MNISNDFRVSVVLNVYKNDDPELFEKALKSVLDQSYLADEILILRNGPVPQAIEKLLRKYSTQVNTITVVELPETLRRGLARHKGILSSKNRYIALMDADDQSCRNRLKVQIEKIIKEKVDIVGGQVKVIDFDTGNYTFRNVPLNHNEIKSLGKKRYPFNNVTLMFDKEKYCALNYEQTGDLLEDYALYAELVKNSWKMSNVSEIVVDVKFSSRDYERRRGLVYLREELSIQKKLLSIGYINKRQYRFNVAVRIVARIFLPKPILALLIQKWFRKKISDSNKIIE